MSKPRLAIIITHPIRYVVPLFKLLSERNKIQLKVFYTYGPELFRLKKYDPQYREKNEKALPLFDGYEYVFVENIAKKKSTSLFSGIDNPTLIKEVEAWKPDAILINGWKFRSHLRAMKYFKGKVPVHFRGDSTLLDESKYNFFKRLFRRIILKRVYRNINKAWYVGGRNKDYFLAMGVDEQKLVHVPHGVDNDRFKKNTALMSSALSSRQALGIDADALVFLYAGKIKKEKGVFVLLDAFLKVQRKNIHLMFAGNGKDMMRLQTLSVSATNIYFLPAQTQTNMPLVYSMADVCVLPSESDTWGLVLNEAMANGLAVIASENCGGAMDLISEGYNGFTFDAGNVDELVSVISKIYGDHQLLNRMKIHSLEKIKDFSYEVIAEKIESVFTGIHQEH